MRRHWRVYLRRGNEARFRVGGRKLLASRRRIEAAMSAAAGEVKKALDSFVRLERHVCSSAPQSDPTIREYAQGLQDWITGFAHWIYETDLYFQGNGEEVKTFGWVFVLPKTGINPVETWISEVKETSRSTNNKP